MVLLDPGLLGLVRRVSAGVPSASSMHPVPFLQLPPGAASVLWGGGAALVLGHLLRKRSPGLGYWMSWIGVGAVALSAVAWFVVPLLQHRPIGGGWRLTGVAATLAVNGAWGGGTAILLRRFGVQRGGA
jgi:hypothetical protein